MQLCDDPGPQVQGSVESPVTRCGRPVAHRCVHVRFGVAKGLRRPGQPLSRAGPVAERPCTPSASATLACANAQNSAICASSSDAPEDD